MVAASVPWLVRAMIPEAAWAMPCAVSLIRRAHHASAPPEIVLIARMRLVACCRYVAGPGKLVYDLRRQRRMKPRTACRCAAVSRCLEDI
jgi:hypothetical protein